MNNNEEQYSNQPICVLISRLQSIFQHIKNELGTSHYSYTLNNLKLIILCEDKKAEGPKSTDNLIQIHDTFLSFLWSYTYGILGVAPMPGKEFTKQESAEATDLLKYSLTLLTEYKVWGKEKLPNPQLNNANKNKFINTTNVCFYNGCIYILYHEFAHIVLGHIERLTRAKDGGFDIHPEERYEMEKEADLFALDKILEKTNGTDKEMSAILGVLVALCSLTFTSEKVSGGKNHPDPDHRIKTVLEKLNRPKSDYFWFFAFWALIWWEKEFYKTANIVKYTMNNIIDVHDYKAVFYNSLQRLDNLKREINSK